MILFNFSRLLNCSISKHPIKCAGNVAVKVCLRKLSSGSKRLLSKNCLIYKVSVFGLSSFVVSKICFQHLPAQCKASSSSTESILSTSRIDAELLQKQQNNDAEFSWHEFWILLKPNLHYLTAAVISAFIVALANIQIPLLLGEVVNELAKFSKEKTNGFYEFMADVMVPTKQLLKLYAVQAFFTFSYITFLTWIGEEMAVVLRKDLFATLLKQDITFYDSHRTGELLSRLTTDVQDFKSSLKLCISQGLRSIAQIIGCGISLYSISPQMTGITAVVVPCVICVGAFFGSLLRAVSKAAQQQVAYAASVADECLGNMRTVKAFSMEDEELSLFEREIKKSANLNDSLGIGIGIFQAGSNLFLNGTVMCTLYLGGSLLSSGQMKPGDLMAFLVAAQTIQKSLSQLSVLFGTFVRGITAGTRIFETVLRRFNLRIPPGRVVALVGASGSGKSTVAHLLERFYDVKTGAISVDGFDIKLLDQSWLRGKVIGFINQEPVLFATSIMENIRYGCPEASDYEVMEAAKFANAHDFIMNFPDRYQTLVGERGISVSGGQKQKIAIARALLKNPTILILDEATSALDAESEAAVQLALDKCVLGRTVLIIAHRLSTIQNAHVIAVLSKGRLAEIGTHEELKKLGGIYADLIRLQHKEESNRNRNLYQKIINFFK